jgi:hypothetical protein
MLCRSPTQSRRWLARFSTGSATESGSILTSDAPLRPQGVRLFTKPASMDNDDKVMMEVLQEDEAEAAAHL